MEILEINNSVTAKKFLNKKEIYLSRHNINYTDKLEELAEEWNDEFNELKKEIGYRDVYKMSEHKKNKVISLYFLVEEINKLIEQKNASQYSQENKNQLDINYSNSSDPSNYDEYLQRLSEEPGLSGGDEYFPTEPE